MSLTATPFRLFALLVVLLATWLPVAQAVRANVPNSVFALGSLAGALQKS